MGNFSSIDISASGLFAQRARLDAIANNIANANTTRTAKGGPYRRQEVLLRAVSGDAGSGSGGVAVDKVVESTDPPKMVYEPGNPDADSAGYVAMPNVNPVQEMVDMITATRAYEANIQAVNAARTMASKALEIGKG
jgi:flagellar basal-body rod protein FlgC